LDTGIKISGVAHGVLIGVAMFGAPLFSADSEKAIQISEVSLITVDDFAAMASGITAPSAQKPDAVLPTPTETAPLEIESVGDVDLEPTAPIAETENIGVLRPQTTEPAPPKSAKTISNAVVETPTDPVKPLPTPKPAVIEVPTPKEPPKPDPEQPSAPKESTTKIVTEAETAESKLAPSSSSRPRGRPKDLKVAEIPKPKPEPKTTPEPAAEPAEDLIAKAIAEDLAKALADSTSQPTPVEGPPMTGAETSGLVFAIQQCWNVPVGLENDASNIITMGVKLNRDGTLEEEPRKIAPLSGSATGILQAFEAARRALIRCQPYDLPAEKYETWREIEIVFNPQQMVLR
jgi:hypothetical protein